MKLYFFFRCGVCVRLWVDTKELVKFWFKHDSAWKPMGLDHKTSTGGLVCKREDENCNVHIPQQYCYYAMNMSYGVVYARLLTGGNSFRVHCFCLRFVDDRHLVLRLSKYGKVFDFLI
ncbi:hypothetical protein P5673_016944 [Acropora cervicornis]|uniref:Uncharacterized protein n=1 Tax=Acropora cervicornis TaxID=6130 RepID=A0AAD9QFY9_ACRCE|nr:hypothetical protein P5673_016944 [Acropora cervicornis]